MNDEDLKDLSDKHEENRAKIERVTAATFDWSSFLSTPIGKSVGALAISLLMFATAWITEKMNRPPAPPVVVVGTDGGGSPVVMPTASKAKVKLFLVSPIKNILSDSSLKDLPIFVDATIYPDGSTYPFGGASIPLPCVEGTDKTGKVVDVRPVSSVADILDCWKAVSK